MSVWPDIITGVACGIVGFAWGEVIRHAIRDLRRSRRKAYFAGDRIRLDPEGLKLAAIADRDAFRKAVVAFAGGAPLDLHQKAALVLLVHSFDEVASLTLAAGREASALHKLVVARAEARAE